MYHFPCRRKFYILCLNYSLDCFFFFNAFCVGYLSKYCLLLDKLRNVCTLCKFQQVGRSLFCLGLLIRYGNSLLSTSCNSNTNTNIKNSLDLFKKYLHAEDFVIKARSLQVCPFRFVHEPATPYIELLMGRGRGILSCRIWLYSCSFDIL